MTFFLNFVVLLVGLLQDRPKESKVLGALAVAACVSSLILFGGPISGASMNPGTHAYSTFFLTLQHDRLDRLW
jgi:glycerol uptake facilitator-like aquaporin